MPVIATSNARKTAARIICEKHYTHTVPSGKSHYIAFEDCFVVWAIPANKNLAKFLLPTGGTVWELARLWAPDGHAPNLLTQAISHAIEWIKKLEHPDLLVSYADPNVGHLGGVYRAASWLYHGQSEETRVYRNSKGQTVARRAFHSGNKSLRKAEIEALGFKEEKLPGKHRFIKPLSKLARKRYVI